MIEPIMYFGIGFLVASLFLLALGPLIHNRAVRLTVRRLEAATPISMAEIQAEKDQLRAEFAMSTRRLEMSVEQLKEKTSTQLGELGRKTVAINRLKQELSDKAATIAALEERERSLRAQLEKTEQEHAAKADRLREIGSVLASKEAELARLTAALSERTLDSDGQRVEIATLRTQVESFKSQVARLQKDFSATEQRLTHERAAAEGASKDLADERGKAHDFGGRIALLEGQLATQTAEAEILARRVEELESRLTDQGRALAEREIEVRQLRESSGTAEGLKRERAKLQDELAQAQAETAKLRQEMAAMKLGSESSWAAERVENALLRERINDIAAEVARLTMALEGPDSPIEMILALDQAEQRATAGPPARKGENGELPQGDLVARIRALQSRASRIAPAP